MLQNKYFLIKIWIVLVIGFSSCRETVFIRKESKLKEEFSLNDFYEKHKEFFIYISPNQSDIKIGLEKSITIEYLRDKDIDDNPPSFRGNIKQPWGDGPFVAKGIRPFRFKYFNNEFNWGGWPEFVKKLSDYTSTRGFDVVIHRDPEGPYNTKKLHWGHMLDWEEYFRKYGLEWQRWDQLADRDVLSEIQNHAWEPIPDAIAMADLEHPWPLSIEKLREQKWYPLDASNIDRQTFEEKYYKGFVKTHTEVMKALRNAGWKTVGIYPQPFTMTWFPLKLWFERDPNTSGIPDPELNKSWHLYGKEIVLSQDILYPDHYVFYWDPANTAYQIAQNDHDMVYANSFPPHLRKPMRPYYWPLLHGGDAHHEWWRYQPLPFEDLRAAYFFIFTSKCDGVVFWNFSERDETSPPVFVDYDYWQKPEYKHDQTLELMVGIPFELNSISDNRETPKTKFHRYDILAITRIDRNNNIIEFQKIDTSTDNMKFKRHPSFPTFRMKIDELIPFLRNPTDTVAAAVEGLALAKYFEDFIYHADLKIDVPAIKQFAKSEPIIRRLTKDNLHLVATYDPQAVYFRKSGRSVQIKNFNGKENLNITFPADSQLRIFLLKEIN